MNRQQKAIIKQIRDKKVMALEARIAELEALLAQSRESVRCANEQINALATALNVKD
jgi:BMFP domain-containing protein YqiC